MWELLAGIKLKSLLGEGISSLASTGAKSAGSKVGEKLLEKFSPKETGDPFGEHGPIAAAIMPLSLTTAERQDLTAFLNSSFFGSVVRATPAFTVGGRETPQLDLILLYLYEILPDKSSTLVLNLAREIVLRLRHAAEAGLQEAAAAGMIFQNEAAISATRGIVASEIASVTAQVLEASPFKLEQMKNFDLFENQYRRQVTRSFAKLRPEALGDAKAVPIESLYVACDLRPFRSAGSEQNISRKALLKSSFRTVILGNPGGGKSTFVKMLCHELGSKYEDALYGSRKLTPVVIILREFAQHRKQQLCSILEYATLRAKADYQLDAIPEGALRYLFITGRALVIFDGLDELIETADRVDVTQAVERFTDQYQATPILVTSREVGYEQAPLDPEKFSTYKLQPFNAEQMQAYVHNWFRLTNEDTQSSATTLAESFVRDSTVVPDLRENPLMLSLLCNLYKKDKHLPGNRPEVYKRCADLLFENWDKFRGVIISLPIEKKLRPAMDHLAHWIYSDKELQAGVTEKSIIGETGNYLSKWCADTDEAISIAEKFVHFFRGRAWVFSDVGSSRVERLYGFTHTTFLEFFTAEHIVKNRASSAELCSSLLSRLLNREWDVVCQLCFQMYAEMRNASDELTTWLTQQMDQHALTEKVRLASFLARTLDLIFPTRLIRATAVSACMRAFLEAIEHVDGLGSDAAPDGVAGLAFEIWSGLTACDRDLRDVNVAQVKSECLRYLIEGSAGDSAKAAVMVVLDLIRHELDEIRFQDPDGAAVWTTMYQSVREGTREIRKALIPASLQLAQSSWWEREITTSDLLTQYGSTALTNAIPFILGNWYRTNIASMLVNSAFQLDIENSEDRLQDSLTLRDYLVSQKHLLNYPEGAFGVSFWRIRGLAGPAKWPSDIRLRDLIVLVSVSSSFDETDKISRDLRMIASPKYNPATEHEVLAYIEEIGLSPEVIEVLRHWWMESPKA